MRKVFADPFIQDGYLYRADDEWFAIEKDQISRSTIDTDKVTLEKLSAIPTWVAFKIVEIENALTLYFEHGPDYFEDDYRLVWVLPSKGRKE